MSDLGDNIRGTRVWAKMSNQEFVSHAWSVVSDRDLAEIYREHHGTYAIPQRELKHRGLHIIVCPECGEPRVTERHDYLCVLCRRTTAADA
jgi:hypothetical protein